jgi:cytochrome c-type biogenesis protein CcsB
MASTAWATLSDVLLVVAVLGYVTAMALHAVEIGVAAPAPAPVTVGAPPPASDVAARRAGAAGAVAVGVTVLAVVVHLGCVLARGAAADRVPLGNMYEFVLGAALAAAVTWLVALAAGRERRVGLFATLALAIMLGVAGTRLHTRVEPLVPALDSPWLRVHVAAAATASGLFLVGFVASVLYLVRLRHDATGDGTGGVVPRLPTAARLDRLAQRLHLIAFPIWTFAVGTGAIWAESAWGRYWAWDPKETWAFISWIGYAAYLHARNTAGWRGRPAAMIAVAGWVTMMINLFAVNMLAGGLHSYAGL